MTLLPLLPGPLRGPAGRRRATDAVPRRFSRPWHCRRCSSRPARLERGGVRELDRRDLRTPGASSEPSVHRRGLERARFVGYIPAWFRNHLWSGGWEFAAGGRGLLWEPRRSPLRRAAGAAICTPPRARDPRTVPVAAARVPGRIVRRGDGLPHPLARAGAPGGRRGLVLRPAPAARGARRLPCCVFRFSCRTRLAVAACVSLLLAADAAGTLALLLPHWAGSPSPTGRRAVSCERSRPRAKRRPFSTRRCWRPCSRPSLGACAGRRAGGSGNPGSLHPDGPVASGQENGRKRVPFSVFFQSVFQRDPGRKLRHLAASFASSSARSPRRPSSTTGRAATRSGGGRRGPWARSCARAARRRWPQRAWRQASADLPPSGEAIRRRRRRVA